MKALSIILGLTLFMFGGSFELQAAPQEEHDYAAEQESLPEATRVATPWLDMHRHQNIVYFLFTAPAGIARYDLDAEMWLTDISLTEAPTAFHVDSDGLFIAFGRRFSKFNLDGTGEAHLGNTLSNIDWFDARGNLLYFQTDDTISTYNKTTDTDVGSWSSFRRHKGFVMSSTNFFAGNTGVTPQDISYFSLTAAGVVDSQTESIYHGDFSSFGQVYLFPSEQYVATNASTIYNAADLTYWKSFGGSFDDLKFAGNEPILLRNNTLIRFSTDILETGRADTGVSALRFEVNGDNLVYFFQSPAKSSYGIGAGTMTISELTPAMPGAAASLDGLAYTADKILMDPTGILYILSSVNKTIFRWHADSGYLPGIPLLDEALHMAYHPIYDKLYLSYPGGMITYIDLASTPLKEEIFVYSPHTPCGLQWAGQYVFVCDPAGAWEGQFTYNAAGDLIDWEDWRFRSDRYLWNATHNIMYWRDGRLEATTIDANGMIGNDFDSGFDLNIRFPHILKDDDSLLLTGTGAILDAVTLAFVDTLSNDIDDGVWGGYGLFTVRGTHTGVELQEWVGANYGIGNTVQMQGHNPQIFHDGTRLIVVTEKNGKPYPHIMDDCSMNGGIKAKLVNWPQTSILDVMNDCSNLDI